MASHDLATITNPSAALTDFTLIVDLSRMSASWWSANDSADGTKGRVFKADGTTELAADWIDFDNVGETGLVRVKWSGTLATTGTQQVWIEPPLAANASYAANATYGSDNAYDASTWGYWPLHDANDRTSNGRNLTAKGGASAGGQTGLIGDSTLLGSSGYFSQEDANYDFTAAHSVCGLFKVANTTNDHGYIGANTGADPQLWFDNASPDRVGLYDGTAAVYGSTNPATDWTHAGYLSNGLNDIDLMVNGSREAGSGNNFTVTTQVLTVGRVATNKYLTGNVQHVYISSGQRTEAWAAQESAQLTDNATFWGTWNWVVAGVANAPIKRVDYMAHLVR